MTEERKTIDIEQLRADIAAGTAGPWDSFMGDVCAHDGDLVIAGMNRSCGARSSTYSTLKAKNPQAQANARRIARLPDLEAEYLRLREENARLREAGGALVFEAARIGCRIQGDGAVTLLDPYGLEGLHKATKAYCAAVKGGVT